MWNMFAPLFTSRCQLDGVSSSQLSNTYMGGLKNAEQLIKRVNTEKVEKGSGGQEEITAKEARIGGKDEQIQKLADKWEKQFFGDDAKTKVSMQVPGMAEAKKVLDAIKEGKPVSSEDLVKFKDAVGELKKLIESTATTEKTAAVEQQGQLVEQLSKPLGKVTDTDRKQILEAITYKSNPTLDSGSKGHLKNLISDEACIKLLEKAGIPIKEVSGQKQVSPEQKLMVLQYQLENIDSQERADIAAGKCPAPPVKANSLRAEIAQDMALLSVRSDCLDQIKAKQTQLAAAPGNKELQKDIILLNPDMDLGTKVKELKKLGMSADDVAGALLNHQSGMRDKIDKQSKDGFQRLGGDVSNMPASIILGNAGRGLGTPALQDQVNKGVGMFVYSEAAIKNIAGVDGQPLADNRVTKAPYAIKDPSKPTVLHFSTIGSEATFANSGKDSNVKIVTDHGTAQFDVHNMAGTKLPAGWQYDAATQTLTIPPNTIKNMHIEQESNTASDRKTVDCFQTTIVAFNAVPLDTHLALDSKDSFSSDDFRLSKDKKLDIPADKLDKFAMLLKDTQVSVDKATLQGNGIGMKDPLGQVVKKPNAKEDDTYVGDRDASKYKDLRHTNIEIELVGDKVKVNVESTVDPVKSNLDQHFKGPALEKYKEFVKAPTTNNDMLSGLRTFGLLEKVHDDMIARGVPKEKADAFLKGADVTVGGKKLDYQTYCTLRDAYDK